MNTNLSLNKCVEPAITLQSMVPYGESFFHVPLNSSQVGTKSWKEFISVQLNVDDDRNESSAFLILDVGLSRALQLRRLSSYVNTHRSVC